MDAIKFFCYYVRSFLTFMFFFSCSNTGQQKKEKVRCISVLIDIEGTEVNRSEGFLFKEDNNGTNFRYKINDKPSRIFSQQKDGSFLLIENGDTIPLMIDDSNIYTIVKEEYKVFRLIESIGQVDGDRIHFLSPDYGLLISKSLTWNRFTEFEIDSESFKILKSIIYNDKTFFSEKEKRKGVPIPPPNTQ